MGALYKGFIATALLSLLILHPVTNSTIGLSNNYSVNEINFDGFDLYICAISGLVITGLLIWVTEYYTGTNYRPVKSVANHQPQDMAQMLFRGWLFLWRPRHYQQ